MSNMEYARRPALAGKNIKRLSYALIRGSLRRADADIYSPVPYFASLNPSSPGLGIDSSHNLLNISLNGTALPAVTIPDSTLTSVLTAINAALSTGGVAYEQDGAIYIQSNMLGVGSIEITGGTAAPVIGFDTTGTRIYSRSGDVDSAPEGRVGNPFGATWPGRAENFSMNTTRQALSRLAGNMDVLYSDLERNDSILRRVTDYTWHSGYLAVGTGTNLYIGPNGGFLS